MLDPWFHMQLYDAEEVDQRLLYMECRYEIA